MKLFLSFVFYVIIFSIFAQQPFKYGNYWGYKNAEGQIIAPARYDTAYSFAHKKAIVAYQNLSDASRRFGLINEKGEEVLPCNYDSIWVYPNGYAMATDAENPKGILYDNNGKAIFINSFRQKIAKPEQWHQADKEKLAQGLIPVLIRKEYFDNNKDTLAPNTGYSSISLLDSQQNYFIAHLPNKKIQILDTTGAKVIDLDFDQNYTVSKYPHGANANFLFSKNDMYYAIDKQAKIFWQGQADSAILKRYGIAFVVQKNDIIFLNYQQKIAKKVDFLPLNVVNTYYEPYYNVSARNDNTTNILIGVKKGDKMGLCNLQGDLVLPILYKTITHIGITTRYGDKNVNADSIKQLLYDYKYAATVDSQYLINMTTGKKIAFSLQQEFSIDGHSWVLIKNNNDNLQNMSYNNLYKGTELVTRFQTESNVYIASTRDYAIYVNKNELNVFDSKGKKFKTNIPASNFSLKAAAQVGESLYIELYDELYIFKQGVFTRHPFLELKNRHIVYFLDNQIAVYDKQSQDFSWLIPNENRKFNQLKIITPPQRMADNNSKNHLSIIDKYGNLLLIFDGNGKIIFSLEMDKLPTFDSKQPISIGLYNQSIFWFEQNDKRYIFNSEGKLLLFGETNNANYSYSMSSATNYEVLEFPMANKKSALVHIKNDEVYFNPNFDQIRYYPSENTYEGVEKINDYQQYKTFSDKKGNVINRKIYPDYPHTLNPRYVYSKYNGNRISPFLLEYDELNKGYVYTILHLAYLNEKGECVENCDMLTPQN